MPSILSAEASAKEEAQRATEGILQAIEPIQSRGEECRAVAQRAKAGRRNASAKHALRLVLRSLGEGRKPPAKEGNLG